MGAWRTSCWTGRQWVLDEVYDCRSSLAAVESRWSIRRYCDWLTDLRRSIIREPLTQFNKANSVGAPRDRTADAAQCCNFIGGGILCTFWFSERERLGRVVGNGQALFVLLVDQTWGGRDVGELGRMRFGDLCEVESAGHDGGTMFVAEEEAVLGSKYRGSNSYSGCWWGGSTALVVRDRAGCRIAARSSSCIGRNAGSVIGCGASPSSECMSVDTILTTAFIAG